MMHEIPEETLNSNIEYCIDEYVRNVQHREMLRDKWFYGLSLEEIAQKYDISVTTTKKVIYDIGDKILLRAAKPKREPIWLFALFKISDILKQLKKPSMTSASR